MSTNQPTNKTQRKKQARVIRYEQCWASSTPQPLGASGDSLRVRLRPCFASPEAHRQWLETVKSLGYVPRVGKNHGRGRVLAAIASAGGSSSRPRPKLHSQVIVLVSGRGTPVSRGLLQETNDALLGARTNPLVPQGANHPNLARTPLLARLLGHYVFSGLDRVRLNETLRGSGTGLGNLSVNHACLVPAIQLRNQSSVSVVSLLDHRKLVPFS